jgi:excisionase family DNA binding protein
MIKSIQFPFLTVYEVARATDLTVPCIYRHIHDGHLDAVKVPGFRQYMIEPPALTSFLKARAGGQFVRPPKRPDKPKAKSHRNQDQAITLTVKEVA